MDGIGWAASAMSAAQTRLDAAAENLSNASTDGYRRARLQGFLRTSGILMVHRRDGSQGALRATGRTLDLAISGSGTFAVRGNGGAIEHTRAGNFMRDRFGRVCDMRGRVLAGVRGPVVLPEGARIESTGAVTRNGVEINRIALPQGAEVRTGFLESANVDAIGEMIDVMTAQRSFETAQKVLSAIDQTRERAASQVAMVRA